MNCGKSKSLRNKFAHPEVPDKIPTLEMEPMKSLYERLERFPVWLNRDSQGRRKGGFLGSDSAL